MKKQTENRIESDKEKPLNKHPNKEIENPESPQKPEIGDGGEAKKDKPEIRYDIE